MESGIHFKLVFSKKNTLAAPHCFPYKCPIQMKMKIEDLINLLEEDDEFTCLQSNAEVLELVKGMKAEKDDLKAKEWDARSKKLDEINENLKKDTKKLDEINENLKKEQEKKEQEKKEQEKKEQEKKEQEKKESQLKEDKIAAIISKEDKIAEINNKLMKLSMNEIEKIKDEVNKLDVPEGPEGDKKNTNGYTNLIDAVLQNNLTLVKKYIDGGANVNRKSEKDGSTAIMYAAQKGNIFMVKLLMPNSNLSLKGSGDQNVFYYVDSSIKYQFYNELKNNQFNYI
jgi:ankyrin repeat protein